MFDYGLSQTSHDFESFSKGTFWTSTVFAAAISEPAVSSALLALNYAYQTIVSGRGVRQPNDTYIHYAAATQHLRQSYSTGNISQLRVVLISCLILLTVDLITQRYVSARDHLYHGRRLLLHLLARGSIGHSLSIALSTNATTLEDELADSFAQLDLQATNFGDVKPQLTLSMKDVTTTIQDLVIPGTFSSIAEAEAYLLIIIHESCKFRGICPDPVTFNARNEGVLERQELLSELLSRWSEALTASRPALAVEKKNARQKLSLLEIRHSATFITLATCLEHGNEMQFDTYLPYFTNIVDSVERLLPYLPLFSLQMAVITPLHIVVQRCRHPHVRRRALELLSIPRREGLWDSQMLSRCDAELISVEEEDAGFLYVQGANMPLNADLSTIIPARSRISEVWAFFPNEDMTILRISLRRRARGSSITAESDLVEAGFAPTGDWEQIDKLVPWDPP